MVGFSSCLVWSFLRHVCITVSHIFTGTGTCPCFGEYFSLGGCGGPGSYNIFIYYTAVIVIRESFTLGGCLDVGMSNAICGCHSFELGIDSMVLLGGSLQYDGFLYGSSLTDCLQDLVLSSYLPWLVTTLLLSASSGFLYWWSIWEGVALSLQVWS